MPSPPFFSINTQWKCIGDLTPPLPLSACVINRRPLTKKNAYLVSLIISTFGKDFVVNRARRESPLSSSRPRGYGRDGAPHRPLQQSNNNQWLIQDFRYGSKMSGMDPGFQVRVQDFRGGSGISCMDQGFQGDGRSAHVYDKYNQLCYYQISLIL